MTIDYEGTSLYSLIADGQHRNTLAGRNVWISLITGASLQPNCDHEGFNIKFSHNKNTMIARLALVANNENDCLTCDSWIGFGASYIGCDDHINQACGNRVVCAASTLSNFPAFGVILVQ